jgi:hypothetical protein
MSKININRLFLLLTFFLYFNLSFGQTFEGYITYKMEVLNPNPEIIPDVAWQKGIKEQLGESGYMLQKYFYKKDKYISEIQAGNENGYQLYNVADKLLYSWQLNSETAMTVDSRVFADDFKEIIENEKSETIMGIVCKSIIVKSKMGEMTIWYNKDYLKIDSHLFEEHKYGHWNYILNKIGCLPLKMEQKGLMSHIVQTAINYKDEVVDDKKFLLPKFKEVIAN